MQTQDRISTGPQEAAEQKIAHNVRRADMERGVTPVSQEVPFICECESLSCLHALSMTIGEYDACHQHNSWAAVRPGHSIPGEEAVVLHRDSYWVVER